jgi:hypothetical protein
VSELGGRRPGFILRFGFAPQPTARTGRRPVAVVIAPSSVLPASMPHPGRKVI